ncbi:MAG: methionyl-tRNA formyltransferase, partial [Ilumatobacteraceae bacterium]
RVGIGFTQFRGKRLNILTAHALDGSESKVPSQFVDLAQDGIVVAAGQGAICLQRVQPEGKPALDALSWSRGARLKPNELFG